jgi:hypothetical protein
MAMTVLEGRTLPSVFSDIPSRSALQEKEKQIQNARQRIGRLWVMMLLLVGALVIAGIAVAYFFNAWQQADSDARASQADVQALNAQLVEYQNITTRRSEIAERRQALFDKIQGERAAWRDDLWNRANSAWRTAGRQESLALAPRDATQPPPARWGARSWDSVYQQADATLSAESTALGAVEDAVERRLRELRRPAAPPCTDPTSC